MSRVYLCQACGYAGGGESGLDDAARLGYGGGDDVLVELWRILDT